MRSSEKWPIWPVNSKPATPVGPGTARERHAYIARRLAAGADPDALRRVLITSFPTYEHVQRARCIGEGLVRARQRMERFTRWLRNDLGACDRGMAWVRRERFMSPEAVIRTSVEQAMWPSWFFDRVDHRLGSRGEWWQRWVADPDRLATCEAFLASPEWAALPWQREAPDASR